MGVPADSAILVCPGDRLDVVDKALRNDVPEIVLDLEDSVALSVKDSARDSLVEYLSNEGPPRKRNISIRINSVQNRLGVEDIIRLLSANCADSIRSLVIPKIGTVEDAAFVSKLMDIYDPGRCVGVQILVESAISLVDLENIVNPVGPRLRALVFGPGDFLRSLNIFAPRVGVPDNKGIESLLSNALEKIVLVSRSRNVHAIDGPVGVFGNEEADGIVEDSAIKAASIGVDAKWAIHPSQVRHINSGFTPDYQRLETARKLWLDYERSLSDGIGAVGSGGNMIDMANAESARDFIRRWQHLSSD